MFTITSCTEFNYNYDSNVVLNQKHFSECVDFIGNLNSAVCGFDSDKVEKEISSKTKSLVSGFVH